MFNSIKDAQPFLAWLSPCYNKVNLWKRKNPVLSLLYHLLQCPWRYLIQETLWLLQSPCGSRNFPTERLGKGLTGELEF